MLNSDFLRVLAQAAPYGSTLWATAFIGNPDMAGGNWGGRPYNPATMAAEVDSWANQNAYFSVASLRPDAGGELARRKTSFARLLVLVADDVDLDDLQGRPSYILQTSPGKFQTGILLDAHDPHCADLNLITRLVTRMAEAGFIKADKSGNNAVRYVRLPLGQNQKPRESGAFDCQLQRFDTEARYTLEDAAGIFGIDLDELLQEQSAPQGLALPASGPQDERLRTLTANILRGENLHDSINMAAVSMVASGMAGGAAVNMLRSLMDLCQAPHDERWKARYADIPRSVATAQQKYAPAVNISLLMPQPADESPEDLPPTYAAAAPVSKHLLTVPGMLGQAVVWINAMARKPQPLFAVQAALALGSVLMGRRYRTDNGNWPMVYFLNVGESGSGKEHPKFAVETLLEAAGLGNLIGVGRFASESGVVSSLIEKPSQFSVLDEFGKLLQGASVAQNFAARDVLKAIMEVWGRADGVVRPVAYSTAGMSSKQSEDLANRIIRKPSLTLLAMTTPDTLYKGLTSEAVADGFLNRLLTVHSDIGWQMARTVQHIDPPAELVEWMQMINAAGAMLGGSVPHDLEPSPVVVPLDAGALGVFRAFEESIGARVPDLKGEGLHEMLTRKTELAMRVALIVAVSCNHPAVYKQDAQYACDYVREHGERDLCVLREKLSDGPFDQLCKAVLAVAREAHRQGVTERDLNRGCAAWRAAPLRMREDALKSLDRRGELSLVEVSSSTGRGRKRNAWVCQQFIVGNVGELSSRPHDANN
jgi:hypothetical protein